VCDVQDPLRKRQVIILGGGLAGLAAAVPLAEEGLCVTVVERRPFLGGRAASYPIPQANGSPPDFPSFTAESSSDEGAHDVPALCGTKPPQRYRGREFVDNCQHVLLRCCTNLLDFYRRLDVEDSITFYDRYLFLDQQGQTVVLCGTALPAPLHLLPSFLGFTPLSWKDRLKVSYAFICMLRQQEHATELDRITMLQWLQQHGQTTRTIERFWRIVLVSALNEEIEFASARYGLKVFLDGMLRNRVAFHMGVPRVPLAQLYTDPSVRFLNARGSSVRLRSSATRIEVDGERVQSILLADGTRVTGDYYVSALPPDGFLKLLPEELAQTGSPFASLRQFESSPITAIYLWFDREITPLDQAALLGRDIQWIFNKKIANGEGNSYIGLVVSASRRLLSLNRSQILEIALRDLKEVIPSAASAHLQRSVVIKEPFATFSCRAGCDSLRLDQKTVLSNLFVAGDWTKTGWPPTMEGAVRSGYRCAELILAAEGKEAAILRADLATEWLPRWISRW
jgi:squalene-associated FAD-dependent desaturase